jgi:hypothetical protein
MKTLEKIITNITAEQFEVEENFETRLLENQEEEVMESDFDERDNAIYDCGVIEGLNIARRIIKNKEYLNY